MKILWFTNTPSLYDQGKHNYHGGGWIESLELLIKEQDGIDLAVSFFHNTNGKKTTINKTTYYPIWRESSKKNPFTAIIGNWRGKLKEDNLDDKFLDIINDFKPDIIQVFGTEGPFTKVQEISDIPVVIHIQGIINPSLNAYYPINYSIWNFWFSKNHFVKNLLGSSPVFSKKRFERQAKRERQFLSKAKFVMGRTHWDHMVAEVYNPNVQYFHVDEVLRPSFYKANVLSTGTNRPYKIISTLSPTVYKGIDVVLKTAKQLKELVDFKFQWEIIGLEENSALLKQFESTEKINHQDVDIICRGRKSPEEMVELMQSASVFVHPSYIDNSPNSVCEAQMLGLPVIACDVGGLSTIIEHSKTGFLIPSNGVFELVHFLTKLNNDEALRNRIGQQASKVASQRHDRQKILRDLLDVYKKLRK